MDKIICLGKNYLEHAKELGDAVPEKPVIFIKPPSILLQAEANRETLQALLPKDSGEVHHECEIVVKLKHGGHKMSAIDASRSIGSVTVGLDMTLRELQAKLKKAGHPWTTAKVFQHSAILGPFLSIDEFSDFEKAAFSLTVNGKEVQTGNAGQMLFKIAEGISYISQSFPLCEGDLIFTGTPKGVGPVKAGDVGKLKYGSIEYSVEWR